MQRTAIHPRCILRQCYQLIIKCLIQNSICFQNITGSILLSFGIFTSKTIANLFMAGNSFGTLFTLTTFGESHGEALGGIIDGCPAGLTLDFEAIEAEMQRRKKMHDHVGQRRRKNCPSNRCHHISQISLRAHLRPRPKRK